MFAERTTGPSQGRHRRAKREKLGVMTCMTSYAGMQDLHEMARSCKDSWRRVARPAGNARRTAWAASVGDLAKIKDKKKK